MIENYSAKGYENCVGYLLIGIACTFLEVFSENADNIVTLLGYYLFYILIF
jgi:hypothetical protein